MPRGCRATIRRTFTFNNQGIPCINLKTMIKSDTVMEIPCGFEHGTTELVIQLLDSLTIMPLQIHLLKK